MRKKHRENRQMRKTEGEQVVARSRTDRIFTVHFTAETASRHSHLTFSQMCLSLLITVVSAFEGDLIGFIHMIMKASRLVVNDVSLCFPIRFHQASVVHMLCLCAFCLLTCHCWLGFAIKAFWILERNNSLFYDPASYLPAEMKNIVMYQEAVHVLCRTFILSIFVCFLVLDFTFKLKIILSPPISSFSLYVCYPILASAPFYHF